MHSGTTGSSDDGVECRETDMFKELNSYAGTIQQLIDDLYADTDEPRAERDDDEDEDDDEDDDSTRVEVVDNDGITIEGRRSSSSSQAGGRRSGHHAMTVIKIGMQCTDVDNTFVARDLKLVSQDGERAWELTVYYNVFHHSKHEEFNAVLEIPATSKIDAIFDIFWSYKLCPECLTLIKKNDDVCEDCTFHKMRQQYGMQKKFITEHHVCMICQEAVYHTRLQCGHAMHHACILGLNPHKWYSPAESSDIRCPACRQPFTDSDKNRFFTCS